MTQDGWSEAWSRFQAVEQLRFMGATFRPGGVLSAWVVALLVLSGVVALVGAVSTFAQTQLLNRIVHGLAPTLSEVEASDSRQAALGGFQLLVSIATWVTWLVWQHRAQRNLYVFGRVNLRFTPGWAVGWWFIPIANLFKPYQAVKELWLASSSDEPQREGRRQLSPPLLPWWWAAYLISGGLAGVAGFLVRNARAPDPLITGSWLLMFSDVVTAIAAVLAIQVVRGVNHRQAEQEAGRAQSSPPSPATPPVST